MFVVYKGVSEFGFVAAVEAFGEDGSSEETSEPEWDQMWAIWLDWCFHARIVLVSFYSQMHKSHFPLMFEQEGED